MFLICSSLVLSQIPENIQRYRNDQKGDVGNRQKDTLDGNRVRTIFSNNGEVSYWQPGLAFAPHLEWPKGTGHRHSNGFSLIVGSKFKITNMLGQDQYVTTTETSFREEMDKDPVTWLPWGFEPIQGYTNSNAPSIAISNDSSTWPAAWPAALGLPAEYNGNWYSHYGKGIHDGVVESFFVMDDSKDKEFTQPPYAYYPIQSDSTHGGMGLRVEVRSMQFQDTLLHDILFWNYAITNISDRSYDTAIVGYFFDPAIGNVPNNAAIDRVSNLIYVWSPSGTGLPDNYVTGYFGIKTLTSLDDTLGVTSMYLSSKSNHGPASTWPKNDNTVWGRLSGGFIDTVMTTQEIMVWCGTGPVALPKWGTKKYALAMVFGTDLQDILLKAKRANKLYQANYIVNDSILAVDDQDVNSRIPQEYALFQNYPNPFNPSTIIRFSIPSEELVTVKIYDLLGKEITTLLNQPLTAGEHTVHFNGWELPSGIYFYRIQAGSFVATKKLLLIK